jgi:hypothetical protein
MRDMDGQANKAAILFVSPDLQHFEVPPSPPFTRLSPDFRSNGVIYRRLDPHYYVWLKGRLDTLGALVDAKKVDVKHYNEALEEFEPIYSWLCEHLGDDKMEKLRDMARRGAGQNDYVPPGQTKTETTTVTSNGN